MLQNWNGLGLGQKGPVGVAESEQKTMEAEGRGGRGGSWEKDDGHQKDLGEGGRGTDQ